MLNSQSELAQKASKRRELKLQNILQKTDSKKNKVTFGIDTNLQSHTTLAIASVPATQNQKWSVADQILINFITEHYHDNFTSPSDKNLWSKIQKTLREGPEGPLSISGEFQNGLIILKQIIEQINLKKDDAFLKKESQISTERDDLCYIAKGMSNVQSVNRGEKTEWSAREQILIAWYQNILQDQFPKTPFKLTPHITVTSGKFYETIFEYIKAGPSCPGSRLGYLESKIEMLSKYMNAVI